MSNKKTSAIPFPRATSFTFGTHLFFLFFFEIYDWIMLYYIKSTLKGHASSFASKITINMTLIITIYLLIYFYKEKRENNDLPISPMVKACTFGIYRTPIKWGFVDQASPKTHLHRASLAIPSIALPVSRCMIFISTILCSIALD